MFAHVSRSTRKCDRLWDRVGLMASESVVDEQSGRKFYLDCPAAVGTHDQLTFILSLHGGGSFGAWQRLYFPAHDYVDRYRLRLAAPPGPPPPPLGPSGAPAPRPNP